MFRFVRRGSFVARRDPKCVRLRVGIIACGPMVRTTYARALRSQPRCECDDILRVKAQLSRPGHPTFGYPGSNTDSPGPGFPGLDPVFRSNHNW